jgi:hypothetical protein
MNLKEFLAVGQSFAGMRSDKSPYALRKDGLLPIFPPSPRFAAKNHPTEAPLVQGDWLDGSTEIPSLESYPQQIPPAPCSPLLAPPLSPLSAPRPSAVARKRTWLFYLSFGLLGRSKAGSDLVQSELSLEKIRVLRNDLADSDLELVLKKKKRAAKPEPKPLSRPPGGPAPIIKTSPWNELTARLFEIGQQ